MSIASFIPEVWSARILENLNKALVYGNLVNTDYEGDITAYGDTVHINSVGRVTIKDYVKGTPIADPDELATTDQTLIIDQQDYFNVAVDDIDKAQARSNVLDQAASTTGYEFGDVSDQYVAGLLKAGTLVTGLGTDSVPLVVTASTAYEYLVAMKTALDKGNVPMAGRWVVVPPEFEGFMLLDTRFATGNSLQGDTRLVEGLVARAAGFDIYKSNNVPNTAGAKYKVIASTSMCATYAQQILETEAYRPQKAFSDALKGLHVYGAKVTRPAAIAVATVNFTADQS